MPWWTKVYPKGKKSREDGPRIINQNEIITHRYMSTSSQDGRIDIRKLNYQNEKLGASEWEIGDGQKEETREGQNEKVKLLEGGSHEERGRRALLRCSSVGS